MDMQAQILQPRFGKNDVQILAGSFDDYSFDDVMQVLGLSRQCLRLKVRRGDAAMSEVLLKAGKVLDARMPPDQTDPLRVFQSINGGAVRGSGLNFVVYHTEPTGVFPAPCAELAELYDKVKAASPQPPRQSATQPAPVGTTEPYYAPTVQMLAPAHAAPAKHEGAPISSASDISIVANIVAKMVLAELQPLIRQELAELARQMHEQAQLAHKLDGRLQSLPQVISAEVRAALSKPR
jgi:hypothetical protein